MNGDRRAPAGPGQGGYGDDAGLAVAGDDLPDRGNACTYLEIMAAEEMAKVLMELGTEALNRDC
jgi:hypothetical protein